MKIDLGMGVVIAAVLLFYLRLILLQWGKAKQLKAQAFAVKGRKGSKDAREAAAKPQPRPLWLGVSFSNGYLTVLGIVFFVLGAFVNLSPLISTEVRAFWWLPILAGLVLFTVLIR